MTGRATFKDPDGDFEITPAVPVTHYPLDAVIRALGEKDGAVIVAAIPEIKLWLEELRHYRETISCSVCGRTVLGREPVCELCHDNALFEAELGDEA